MCGNVCQKTDTGEEWNTLDHTLGPNLDILLSA